MAWKIPLADVVLGPEEEAALIEVLRSGWLTQGEVTARFEAAFAELAGTEHAIAVGNCTAALQLAYAALHAPPQGEVIVPSLTFVATASAARAVGLTPVFADIRSLTDLTLDPEDVRRRTTERTVAITAVHYAGYPCDMVALGAIAAERGVALIEDCAHAPGATGIARDGSRRRAGGLGDVGCFSFYSNKNLTTGEGGMVTTDREDIARTARLLRSHGMTTSTWQRHEGHAFSYEVLEPGYNFRLDELRSALGLVQLERLPALNARRRELVARYRTELGRLDGVAVPFADRETDAPHLVVVLLPQGADRLGVMASMREAGVQTSIHYPPSHRFACYRDPGRRPLSTTDQAAERLLTLPLNPKMSDDDVVTVVDALATGLEQHGGSEP
ncbi:MAG: DegT/DnrJ/EryC1/StrS family aminotransferase [Deltaproteobacteria bacterium]|jgi:dTDP-4-amino-4,6-dideoxygalactose transaminase|nr:DegT/DnrJ/EryC1/StrS family aminotransferase [Deltaproteobacteria bacterium]MBW2532019.1 DegT/DnrJ/EryC1/StrS family aminotransferase [Deltaproteobacteria bacterium]